MMELPVDIYIDGGYLFYNDLNSFQPSQQLINTVDLDLSLMFGHLPIPTMDPPSTPTGSGGIGFPGISTTNPGPPTQNPGVPTWNDFVPPPNFPTGNGQMPTPNFPTGNPLGIPTGNGQGS